MSDHNKSHKKAVDVFTAINDLIVFKIANLEIDNEYKAEVFRNPRYEEKIKNFFEREIINYACRRAPVLSDSFWDFDIPEIDLSKSMNFRFESGFKNSKLRVQNNNDGVSIGGLENLRLIEFFSTETIIEAEFIRKTRDIEQIHSYLLSCNQLIREIFDNIIDNAILDLEKFKSNTQLNILKDLVSHLINLEQINIKNPELSLRLRKCKTKATFPEKSDCTNLYFYANRQEEKFYCSKKCKIDFPLFENSTDPKKRVRRRNKGH